METQYNARIVFLRVDNFLVVCLADKRQYRSVKPVGGLDNKRNKFFVSLGVEIFDLLTAVFLMPREVEIRAVMRSVYLAPAEREQEFDIASRLCVMGEFLMIVIAQMIFVKKTLSSLLPAIIPHRDVYTFAASSHRTNSTSPSTPTI